MQSDEILSNIKSTFGLRPTPQHPCHAGPYSDEFLEKTEPFWGKGIEEISPRAFVENMWALIFFSESDFCFYLGVAMICSIVCDESERCEMSDTFSNLFFTITKPSDAIQNSNFFASRWNNLTVDEINVFLKWLKWIELREDHGLKNINNVISFIENWQIKP